MSDESIEVLKKEFEIYKTNTDTKIDDLKKEVATQDDRIRVIETSKEKTDYQYEQIMETLNKLNNVTIPGLTAQIEELKNKPVKRYDQVISGILGAITGAVGSYIVNLLFKP